MSIDKADSGDEGNASQVGPPMPDRPTGLSPVVFRLDPASGVPTYLQLVQQVQHALRLGYLRTGDQLPRVRDVVGSLAINPNTVLKAYKELEVKGLVAGRPGQGTFIAGTLGQVEFENLTRLRRTLQVWLDTAEAAGLDEDGIAALFATALHDRRDGQGSPDGRSGPDGRGSRAGTEGAA